MNRDECLDMIKGLDTQDKRINFVSKYLFHGTPHVFSNREEEYFEFRNRIATKFDISFHEVFIVGSAKLGFSYHKEKLFDYDSDIDVVMVNNKLFEKFYSQICDYQYKMDKNHRIVSNLEKSTYYEFMRYLIKGWMRPDKLPTSFQIDLLRTEWFDFFESISNEKSEVGNYKVAAGLFKDYSYLYKYYSQGIENTYNILRGF
ncbi:hypothetical protein [Moraxella sp. CTOTU49803]|uniref:hypothetical protein n=1 Tax=Moraxella sp. CTOTU49803 TaxID=2953840 RepID=UPI0028B11CBC|nr:hypothetical protein [Moraxella sp. CTOTU49803]